MPIRRTLKNVVKNYSESQVKVREATSNDPWGPSSTVMSEISDYTYNVMAFSEIMQMIWKRLNDHGKNWRHVYKSLVLLDYLIKTGSEKVAQQCRENIYTIQTLKDFQYIEEGKDHGMNVREKTKQLVNLLKDDERLRNERAKALKAKERFAQSATAIGSTTTHRPSSPPFQSGMQYSDSFGTGAATSFSDPGSPLNHELESARPSSVGEEELQLQLAIAMSKEEAEEEEKKRQKDEVKLQMAIEESKKLPPGTNRDNLLDLASANANVTNDPWSSPAANLPPPPSKASSSPWAVPGSQPAQASDPWKTEPALADPWATNHNSSMGSHSLDAWLTDRPTNGTNAVPAPSIDDDFDLLSSRSLSTLNKSPNTTSGSTAAGNTDLWNFDALNSSLDGERSSAQARKTPQDFLGPNANLVNLDNLVTKPAAGTLNPFAMTIPASTQQQNPFGQVAGPPRVTLSQMQKGPTTTGFNSGLPDPLLQPPRPSSNPFLL